MMFLFNVAMEDVIKNNISKLVRVVAYADDTAVIMTDTKILERKDKKYK